MASPAASTASPTNSVREGAARIREIGRSAATHEGNAAALLRLAARERERSAKRT